MVFDKESVYAVLMAGGRGRRLWPLSTSSRPKQFVELDGQSLLSRTYRRVRDFLPPERIMVVTGAGQGNLVLEQTPDIPTQNVIEEPVGKNTAPCLGLAAVLSESVLEVPPSESVMLALPADHLISDQSAFRDTISRCVSAAREYESLVTIGIRPTRPATGYGYIESGPEVDESTGVREVLSFTEKPDSDRAERFLSSGNYYWNSGSFVWKTDVILNKLKKHLPKLLSSLSRIREAYSLGDDRKKVLSEEYSAIEAISIDYGILEESSDRLVIPASMGWNDVGDWASMGVFFDRDEKENAIEGDVLTADSSDNLLYNSEQKPLVAIGLDEFVVVNTEDGILVMEKSKAQELKPIVDVLEEDNHGS